MYILVLQGVPKLHCLQVVQKELKGQSHQMLHCKGCLGEDWSEQDYNSELQITKKCYPLR